MHFFSKIAVIFAVLSFFKVDARSLQDIKKTKELRICLAVSPGVSEVSPEGCTKNCTYSGFAYEMSLSFLQYLRSQLKTDIKPVIKVIPWDEQFWNKDNKTEKDSEYTPKYLANGSCDFYPSNLTKLPWREKKMDFVTLFPSRMMVVTYKSNKPKLKKITDLSGKTAAIELNTSFYNWIKHANENLFKDNPIKIVILEEDRTIELVNSEKVDFTLYDADSALYVTKNKANNSVVAFPVGERDEIGWAFAKDDKDLQNAVREFFDIQKKTYDSDLKKIWLKYFGVDFSTFVDIVEEIAK